MINFLFWNVNRKDVNDLLRESCEENEIDILVLAENISSPTDVLKIINKNNSKYYYNTNIFCEKFSIYTSFDPGYFKIIKESARYSLRILSLPGSLEHLIGIIHLPDKSHYESHDYLSFSNEITHDVVQIELDVKHQRTVLFGDFNMNPFEPEMVSGMGLHAVNSRQVASEKSRIVQGKEWHYFYNPMWNFLGDEHNKIPGTYFYRKSSAISYFWNTFDQVLVRPEIQNNLPVELIKILNKVLTRSLLGKNNYPDNSVSDHLPIKFSINI